MFIDRLPSARPFPSSTAVMPSASHKRLFFPFRRPQTLKPLRAAATTERDRRRSADRPSLSTGTYVPLVLPCPVPQETDPTTDKPTLSPAETETKGISRRPEKPTGLARAHKNSRLPIRAHIPPTPKKRKRIKNRPVEGSQSNKATGQPARSKHSPSFFFFSIRKMGDFF